jgi:hypothetical protein
MPQIDIANRARLITPAAIVCDGVAIVDGITMDWSATYLRDQPPPGSWTINVVPSGESLAVKKLIVQKIMQVL